MTAQTCHGSQSDLHHGCGAHPATLIRSVESIFADSCYVDSSNFMKVATGLPERASLLVLQNYSFLNLCQ